MVSREACSLRGICFPLFNVYGWEDWTLTDEKITPLVLGLLYFVKTEDLLNWSDWIVTDERIAF